MGTPNAEPRLRRNGIAGLVRGSGSDVPGGERRPATGGAYRPPTPMEHRAQPSDPDRAHDPSRRLEGPGDDSPWSAHCVEQQVEQVRGHRDRNEGDDRNDDLYAGHRCIAGDDVQQ